MILKCSSSVVIILLGCKNQVAGLVPQPGKKERKSIVNPSTSVKTIIRQKSEKIRHCGITFKGFVGNLCGTQ